MAASPSPPPASPSDLADRLGAMRAPWPLRGYQERAIAAFDRSRAAGDRRVSLAMPPGSGKTLVGLEIARRVGRPTLILGPTTTIQGQWLEEWAAFLPPLVPGSGDGSLPTPLTALTYQALCVVERDAADGEHDADPGPAADAGPTAATGRAAATRRGAATGRAAGSAIDPSIRRRLIARGGDREAVLGLLHPNGRQIVERLAASGPWTLVLDECHHLLELWGHLLEAVVDELGEDTIVVGLTATPPVDLPATQAALHARLFSERADYEVVTPAVVRDGFLAPYQELAYLTRPLPAEQTWIADQQARFDALITDLLDPGFASLAFLVWLRLRVEERRSPEGVTVGWDVIERDDPDLAQAALRLHWSRGEPAPAGAHVREQHRRAPEAADWMALLGGYVREVLDASGLPGDAAARERIRLALPSVGFQLTRQGIRAGASVADRVLALSGSKAVAAVEILDAEERALGRDLRAVLLCDYETASRAVGARLRGVLDPAAGSAAFLMRTLLDASTTRALDPVLVTGRSVACARATAGALLRFAAGDPVVGPMVAGYDPLADPAGAAGEPARSDDLLLLEPGHPGWTPRAWVPLVTAFLESGGTRCLVGTRGLLGEGWDSPTVNVLIDLSVAATSVSVHQMRGRSLRLDPARPHKVADNWDVVCVAPEHLKGAVDYARFARKHRSYFALTAQGEIESGVSHVDPTLSPFGPPQASTFAALDSAMLARTRQREGIRSAWRIGEAYRDVPVETVRVHLGRDPGLPGRDLLRAAVPDRSGPRVRRIAALTAGSAGLAAVAGLALGAAPLGILVALALLAAGGGWGVSATRDAIARLAPSAALEDMARALVDALVGAGLIPVALGAAAVRIVPQADGYYRCFLDGAGTAETRLFAESLDELLSPLWEPRWIIPRRIATPTPSLAGTALMLLRRGIRRVRPGLVVYHAVPSALARRRDRVAAFEVAWGRWVSTGARAIPERDPHAAAVLALHRGDDPFVVETQMRTLWT